MEINARLQVEHPVTEYVTGLDLISHQIDIAGGKALSLTQDEIVLRGHAIECRVYAEDPETFLPCPGTISRLCFPDPAGGTVRIEHAIRQGSVIPPYYDPMLAKVIAWGKDRCSAIKTMSGALRGFLIEGVKTTIEADLSIIESEEFVEGDFNTSFLSKEQTSS